ncbi:MAG TPA: hypothetical protein VKP88_05395 [Candidatus Paceibacterota bacterium]|nr:hypothetical protein [Candidatus Paceibacterota bacterium]
MARTSLLCLTALTVSLAAAPSAQTVEPGPPLVAETDAFVFETDDQGQTYLAWFESRSGERTEVRVEYVGHFERNGETFISLVNSETRRWFHGTDGPGDRQGFWLATTE